MPAIKPMKSLASDAKYQERLTIKPRQAPRTIEFAEEFLNKTIPPARPINMPITTRLYQAENKNNPFPSNPRRKPMPIIQKTPKTTPKRVAKTRRFFIFLLLSLLYFNKILRKTKQKQTAWACSCLFKALFLTTAT